MQANLTIKMIFREANIGDVAQIQIVRHSVKENVLSDPGLVTDQDCADYLVNRGKGWVCEADGKIIGFAIADLADNNIWALFVDPRYERMGIGRKLHEQMLDWYFSQGKNQVWLGTSPGTRAALFYRRAGWVETGTHGKGEIKFEMEREHWLGLQEKSK
jgi:GNAT superfamily N-acetyltransferase